MLNEVKRMRCSAPGRTSSVANATAFPLSAAAAASLPGRGESFLKGKPFFPETKFQSTIMNYATIKYYDIANGPGVRTSVFVSGCRHHCPGCFNAVAWDFGYGQPFDKAVRNEVFAACQPDYIAGLSLLGGEPMEPENQRELLPFVRNFKALYPNKTVWCYSGYTWEQLTGSVPCPARCEATDELLALLDVLVDGRFVEAQHDISLRFRGSSNQRLLDVPKSLAAGQPVWWEDEQVFATHSM